MSKRTKELTAVIVSTKSGQSIKGLLLEQGSNQIVIRAASVAAVETNGITWHSLDGDVVVPMENVDFWQAGVAADVIDTLADREEVAKQRRSA